MIRVVLADDHTVVRAGLREILKAAGDIEVVGEAAIKVNPYDVREIAQAIRKLLDDKELRREMAARGLKRVNEFSWEKGAMEILKLYKQVVGKET